MTLVEELSQRYLVREEDNESNDISREDIENHKQEIVHAIQRSLFTRNNNNDTTYGN